MGENKRYGSDLSDSALNEFLIRPRPLSLQPDELQGQPVTEADGSDEVDAWVRYPESPVRVRGRVIAYTSQAIRVEFEQRDGATHRVWVWRGAVTMPAHGR
ncbi:MAG: hypothetical protein V4737_10965 [Curtobacterium sp.]